MSNSERLSLPYLQPSQAQKHVTHNEALQKLDILVQLAVEAVGAATPPGVPSDGEVHGLGPAPTGAWAGHADELAAWANDAWYFIVPQEGWRALDKSTGRLLVRGASGWNEPGAPDLSNVPGIGINTTWDATNRLSVSAPATLLSHEGAGHQVKLNKATDGDTASLLFQTGWSGRAEFGTTGSDDFAIKVSPDGATWHTAVSIDRNTGRVNLTHGDTRERLNAARTYHVDPTNGDDGNDGLSPGTGAFASLQTAIDTAAGLDLGIHDVTISLADDAYGEVQLRTLVGAGKVIISGNTANPANVTVTGTAASAFAAVGIAGLYRIEGMTVSSSGEDAFQCDGPTVKIDIGEGCILGACDKNHFSARNGATIVIDADYEITGGAQRHVLLSLGYFVCKNRTVTLTGTPGFSNCFALARNVSFAAFSLSTFSGAATGSRYLVELNSVISTNSAGAGFLPGDSAGTSGTGGQYA